VGGEGIRPGWGISVVRSLRNRAGVSGRLERRRGWGGIAAVALFSVSLSANRSPAGGPPPDSRGPSLGDRFLSGKSGTTRRLCLPSVGCRSQRGKEGADLVRPPDLRLFRPQPPSSCRGFSSPCPRNRSSPASFFSDPPPSAIDGWLPTAGDLPESSLGDIPAASSTARPTRTSDRTILPSSLFLPRQGTVFRAGRARRFLLRVSPFPTPGSPIHPKRLGLLAVPSSRFRFVSCKVPPAFRAHPDTDFPRSRPS